MISHEPETGDHSTAQPESPPRLAILQDVQALAPQWLDIGQIDVRMDRWRLPNLQDFQRLQGLIRSEGRIRDPVLVSTAVEPGRWVLVDGFKRLRVAKEMGFTHLWVQTAQLDAEHAKAAILHCNQPRAGLSALEEALIVHSLCLEHALLQIKVAELLKRDESWVSRRLKLAKGLDESVQDNVKRGALSATVARELSQLPRGNQQPVARAAIDHDLSSRECARLVQKLRDTHDEKAAREVLDDPRRYIDFDGSGTERTRGSDPRLSKDGNRLRSSLLSWQRLCSRLTDDLRRVSAADARVLEPLMQDAVTAGTRAVRQLETTHSSSDAHLRSTQGEAACGPPAP
jgi:ParB/RepB/Spo0J family partition protein